MIICYLLITLINSFIRGNPTPLRPSAPALHPLPFFAHHHRRFHVVAPCRWSSHSFFTTRCLKLDPDPAVALLEEMATMHPLITAPLLLMTTMVEELKKRWSFTLETSITVSFFDCGTETKTEELPKIKYRFSIPIPIHRITDSLLHSPNLTPQPRMKTNFAKHSANSEK